MADDTQNIPAEEVAEESNEQVSASTEEHVSVEAASDEEIDAYLAEAIPSFDPYADYPDAEEQQLEADEDDSEDSEEDQQTEETEEQGTTSAQAKPETLEPPVSRAEHEALKAQLEKALTHSKHQADLIQRRSVELGALRAEKKTLRAQLAENLKEQVDDNPLEAMETRDQIKALDADLKQLDDQEAYETHMAEAISVVEKNVDTSKIDVQELGLMLRDDGLPPQFVEKFCSNPFAQCEPIALVQMLKRSQERAEVKSVIKKLVDRVYAQDTEIKKLKTKPEQQLRTVSKVLRDSSKAKAPGRGTGRRTISADTDFTKLSDSELEEYFANQNGA